MRFLVDANLPRRTAETVRARGYEALDVRDIGLGAADDQAIAACAKANGLVLLSRDYDFADIRNYPPAEYPGIVVLFLPAQASAQTILETIDRFLSAKGLVQGLAGKLTIVEPGRVRIRPG